MKKSTSIETLFTNTVAVSQVKQFMLIMLTLAVCGYSCSANKPVRSNDVVFIVHDAPVVEKFLELKSGGALVVSEGSPFMRYVDDSLRIADIRLAHSNDTVTITSNSDYIEVEYQFYRYENRYFLLKVGDTVHVSFNANKEPIMISSKDKKLTELYNFYFMVDKKRFDYNFMAPTIAKFPEILFSRYMKTIMSEKEFKDSRYYAVYTDPDTLQKEVDEFFGKYENGVNEVVADEGYKFWIKYQLDLNKSRVDYSVIPQIISDSLSNFISYHKHLIKFIDEYRTVKGIPFSRMTNGRYDSIGGERCNHLLFEQIKKDSNIAPKTKLIILRHSLLILYNHRDINYEESKIQYFSMGGTHKDLDFEKKSIDYTHYNTLELDGANGEKLTLKDVLDKNRGKVIYLDFWATNCGPCMEAMPDARKLRKELAGKDVAFVFVALWDKKELWENSWRQIIGNEDDYQSYFATNSKDSKMLKDLDIESIPRYMLFDKSGKLVDQNTLSPHSPQAKDFISKYIE